MEYNKDIMAAIEDIDGKINPDYDIDVEDIQQLYSSSSHWFDMICNSFKLGYLQGQKAERAASCN